MNHQRRRNNSNHNRQHQRLRKARSLWDETRKPNASKKAFLEAILYELQPIRYSEIQKHSSKLYNITFHQSPIYIQKFTRRTLPFVLNGIFQFLVRRTFREWMYIIAFIIYWCIVVYLHQLLHAGPMIVISTILILIFTIGLGDKNTEEDDKEGYVSAYSVFNRGFQSILGSLDVDNLVAQHVGGGGFAAAAAAGMGNHGNNREMDDNDDGFGGGNAAGGGRRRNRAGQNQRNQNERNQMQQPNNDNNNNNNNNNNQNRSRKSGKKARRKRNIEEKRERRREIELQREAAAALGFGGQEGVDDIVAMNRLIEEQVHDGFDGGNGDDDDNNNDDDGGRGIDENENQR